MNKVILMGRLTRDPEVRYSQAAEPMAIARFSLAINRRVSGNSEGTQTADFINCVAFGKNGEFAENKAAAENGGSSTEREQNSREEVDSDGFLNIPDGIEEELPFN